MGPMAQSGLVDIHPTCGIGKGRLLNKVRRGLVGCNMDHVEFNFDRLGGGAWFCNCEPCFFRGPINSAQRMEVIEIHFIFFKGLS